MATATVTSKGQITIPKEIRRLLKIRPGDSVDFFVESDGRVVMKQATLDIEELEGLLHRPGIKAVSIVELNRIVRRRGAGRR
jgi:AbrB family looped-hinge helix DNA binding protein